MELFKYKNVDANVDENVDKNVDRWRRKSLVLVLDIGQNAAYTLQQIRKNGLKHRMPKEG